MIYLLLSVLSSTLILIVFKLYERFNITILQAIIVNYFVACACGLALSPNKIVFSDIPERPWFFYTLILGCLFIIVFNLMAITTQKSGISAASVATKMSVAIPVIFGLIYYKESLGVFKSIGIILALFAVYLTSIKKKEGLVIKPKNLLFPILVFLGSGLIDSSIKYLEETFVAENEVSLFSATVFGAAGTVGILVIIVQIIMGKFTFSLKNVIGGIALGIPNYFSMYFLVMALRGDFLESSGIFTVNNVLIVIVSTITAILFFKERLLLKNWIGVGVAVVSILLIALGKW